MSELYVYPQDDGITEMQDLFEQMKTVATKEAIKKIHDEEEKEKARLYRKEYREKNKEKVKESNDKWLEKNKAKMLEKRKIKLTCPECGGVFRKDNWNRHILTQKHKIAIAIKNSPHRKK
jgi:hypothetical protein